MQSRRLGRLVEIRDAACREFVDQIVVGGIVPFDVDEVRCIHVCGG